VLVEGAGQVVEGGLGAVGELGEVAGGPGD